MSDDATVAAYLNKMNAPREVKRAFDRLLQDANLCGELTDALSRPTTISRRPQPKREVGSWMRHQCYRCGHHMHYESTGCSQCGLVFDGLAHRRIPLCTCEVKWCIEKTARRPSGKAAAHD